MDRSKVAFNKYVGLAVIAYNLHKIGRKAQIKVSISHQSLKNLDQIWIKSSPTGPQ